MHLTDEAHVGAELLHRTTRALKLSEAGERYDGREGPASLRPVLVRLLADPDRVAALGRLALERVRAAYSWSAVTDTYERLFYELAGDAR